MAAGEAVENYDIAKINSEFARICGSASIDAVKGIIARLAQDKPTVNYFKDAATKLPSLDIALDTGEVRFSKKRQAFEAVNKDPIGSGAYGTIYKSVDGSSIYKKIELEGESEKVIEEKAREIFLEAYIQTVLSCDENYGRHVCKIRRLYRAGEYKMATTREGAAAAAAKPLSIALYIVMEPLYKNLYDTIENQSATGGHKLTKGEFLPTLGKITEILHYFERVYKFRHRDFHAGNVMFPTPALVHPVLIDFGLSCLTLGDVTYSFVADNVIDAGEEIAAAIVGAPCQSYDLLILVTSLYQYSASDLDNNCLEFLKKSTEGVNGKYLIDALPSFKDAYNTDALFHMVYNNIIMNEGDVLYDRVAPYKPFKHIEPEDFIPFVNGALLAGGRRRHTFRSRRSTRRRRSTRHRKN